MNVGIVGEEEPPESRLHHYGRQVLQTSLLPSKIQFPFSVRIAVLGYAFLRHERKSAVRIA